MSVAPTTAPLLGEPLPVELMNTVWADRDGVHDALATPADTAAWMRAVADRPDVEVPELTRWLDAGSRNELASVHRSMRHLRDAARCLAARRTDDPRDAGTHPISATTAVATVNDLASSAPAWPVLDWSGSGVPEVGRTSEAAAGSVLVADIARATIAVLAGSGLRACLAPGCVLYFIKQHPRREWCSDACGNRARQARHYRRNRPPATQ
jgi:predicted RNA-binding Zn ribbon-like protein